MNSVVGPVYATADVKQTEITVFVQEKFSNAVLHEVLSLDTSDDDFSRYDFICM